MNPILISSLVFLGVFGAGLLSLLLRSWLPSHHLNAGTKDTVRIAMALVATMVALVLGLLIASAKATYDTKTTEVTAMGAKIAFLDRLLEMYGPEASEARVRLRQAVQRMTEDLWPQTTSGRPRMDPDTTSAEAAYHAIQGLSPQNESQRELKAKAMEVGYDFGQVRWLLLAQAGSTISTPLLVIVVCWLAILFFSFGLFSPSNGTVIAALLLAALSVAGAIFLVAELDQPFGGLIRISSQPITSALVHAAKSVRS